MSDCETQKKMHHETANGLLERLKSATGLGTVTELAVFFGIRMSLIFDWQRRGRIPESHQDVLRENGIDPHWVMAGRKK